MTDRPKSARTRSRGLFRTVARVGKLLLIAWLIVVAVFAFEQRSLIYVPEKGSVLPQDWGLHLAALEEVTVAASDGITLRGWLLRADHPSLAERRRLVILFSGNASHRGYRTAILRGFQSLGVDSLICDYRGFAENPGKPTEELLALDARAVWDHAMRLGYSPGDIVVCGQSLGGGVAVRLAADLRREGVRPGGLILRATFTSLIDMGRHHYPWLPHRLILVDRYDSLKKIGDIDCPILLVHGTQDRVVPYSLGQRLFRAAADNSANGVAKSLLTLPDMDHNQLMLAPPVEELEAWRTFFDRISTSALTAEPMP